MNSEHTNQPTDRMEVFCNQCHGYRHHACVGMYERRTLDWGQDEEEDGPFPPFEETFIYKTWQCLGCLSVSLEERYTNSAMRLGDQVSWDSSLYPERTRNHLTPKHFAQLPKHLTTIYSESLKAFNNSTRLLCASGLRSLIEGICKDKNIKGRTLQELIDGLAIILPANIVANLHGLRFMGNMAVHELTPPEPHDLRMAIEICEDLLNFVYELDYKTARLGHLIRPKRHAPETEQEG